MSIIDAANVISLLIIYLSVIKRLYQLIKNLKEMNEEKQAIVTQIVVFAAALSLKTIEGCF